MAPPYAIIFMGVLEKKVFKDYDRKLTASYPRKDINFLDISVNKKYIQLFMDLCIKPTDTHEYLHASSCHVYHSENSIPYSQALSIISIKP